MRNAGIQLRVSDLLFALQKRWKLIISLSFLGLVFGLLLTAMTYVQDSVQYYRVRGSLAFTTTSTRGTYLGNSAVANANDYRLAVEMIDAVEYVIRSERVMNEVINDLEMLGISASSLRSSLSLSQTSSTPILTMTLEWNNPEAGLEVWNAILNKANELIPKMLMIGKLEILNEPVASTMSSNSGGSGKSTAMILAVLGFGAGAGYAVLELLMRPTLNNVKDIENLFGLETVGMIPVNDEYFRKSHSLLIQDDVGASDVVQNFSSCAYILRNRLGTKETNQCFYVTSAINREGRSAVAANLAIQLSDMEHRTLLVDFDTHNPSLGSLFMSEVDYNHSLNALYRGEINEVEAITTLTGYLDILPMVLEHNQLSMDGVIVDLINKLKEKYQYIIIDAPPVGKESDTLSLNQVASTVLFVVGYDQSTIPEIQTSLDRLDKSGIRVVGCVVNKVQSSRFSLVSEKAQGTAKKKKTEQQIKKNVALKKSFFGRPSGDKDETVDVLIDASKDNDVKRAAKKAKKAKKKTDVKKAAEVQQPQTDQPADVEPPTPPVAAFRPTSRNVFEDLLESEKNAAAPSDQTMVEKLMELGMENTQSVSETPDSSQNS